MVRMKISAWLVLAIIMLSPFATHADAGGLAGVGANPAAANATSDEGNARASLVSEPRIIPRFEGAIIGGYHYWPINTARILLGPVNQAGSPTSPAGVKTITGAQTLLIYKAPPDTPEIAIQQYYETLIQKAGGGIAYSCDKAGCGSNGMSASNSCLAVGNSYYHVQTEEGLVRTNQSGTFVASHGFDPNLNNITDCHYSVGFIPANEKDGNIYISVIVWNNTKAGPSYNILVNIVEASKFKVKSVHLNADTMAATLSKTGKVAVYGIYFDTDRFNLKPKSTEAIQQIAKLLGNEPALHVLIVGHTDNHGDYNHNIILSQNRAEAVYHALVNTYHIDPSRLKPVGDGMTAPVATNQTPAGRALNRRVELVQE